MQIRCPIIILVFVITFSVLYSSKWKMDFLLSEYSKASLRNYYRDVFLSLHLKSVYCNRHEVGCLITVRQVHASQLFYQIFRTSTQTLNNKANAAVRLRPAPDSHTLHVHCVYVAQHSTGGVGSSSHRFNATRKYRK